MLKSIVELAFLRIKGALDDLDTALGKVEDGLAVCLSAGVVQQQLTDSGILCPAEHDGLENDMQTLHGDTGASSLDLGRDTRTERLPVVKWTRTEKLEERVEFLDVVLVGQLHISDLDPPGWEYQ